RGEKSRRFALLCQNEPRASPLRYLPSLALSLLAVLGAGLLAEAVALLGTRIDGHGRLAIQDAADNVIADARQVADTAAAHQHDRVLLQVVAFAGDVGGDFLAIGQADAGHLAQGRVGLLGRHDLDLQAHAALLRTTRQCRMLRLAVLLD